LALLGAARGLTPICGAAFLVGLASDIYRPASNALVADLVGSADRRRAFALLFWAVNLGFSVASVSAGYLAGVSYTLLFVIDAATCLAFAGVVLVGIRVDPPRPPVADVDRPAGYRTALRDPIMLWLVVLTVVSSTVYSQNSITLPLAVSHHGLPPRDYGLILAVNGLLIVALQPAAVRLLRRFDRMRVMAVGSALIGLGFWLTTFATSVGQYMGTVVVWTVGEIATAGLAGSLVADLAPPEARGRYAAVWGSSFGLATLTAPLFGTWTYQFVGPAALWAACLLLGLIVAVGFVALRAPVNRRVAAAAPVAPAPLVD
jgi:MFS family permease